MDYCTIAVREHCILFDHVDLQLVENFHWFVQTSGTPSHSYAVSTKRPKVAMHRLILAADSEDFVDHINGNGLDNRRENIRICSRSQNMMNKRSVAGAVPFKGVWAKSDGRRKKYCAEIVVDGKRKFLGTFYEAFEAAKAYDDAASELFGEFACTNQDLGLLARTGVAQ